MQAYLIGATISTEQYDLDIVSILTKNRHLKRTLRIAKKKQEKMKEV